MTLIEPTSVYPWAPHRDAAPKTSREGLGLATKGNGTRSCCGGWRLVYRVEAAATYRLCVGVRHDGIDDPRDSLDCVAHWAEVGPDDAKTGARAFWDALIPRRQSDDAFSYERIVRAPDDADHLTITCTLRWTNGKAVWSTPEVERVDASTEDDDEVTIAVVTGAEGDRKGKIKSIADNIAYYSRLCELAIAAVDPDLLVLPEIALQWGLSEHGYDTAVSATGPEVGAFAEIARRSGAHILVGAVEREDDAVFNSAILLGPDGAVVGAYRKVHLAVGEHISGILGGDGFPVFETPLGRIGCNICKDSSFSESSRLVGLGGADFLLLPIMGDHRASRWSKGSPSFDEDRWRAIMRVRAMDNQLCLVAARNNSRGSCVLDRSGEFLAWNDGSLPFVTAKVARDDDYRMWNGGCFRDDVWTLRRPRLYDAYANEGFPASLD